MPKIGIVLAGCASKGAYEIGCLRAIEEYFGKESISCICSASVGSLVAQAFGHGKLNELSALYKSIDPKKHGRFFLSFSGNRELLDRVCKLTDGNRSLPFEHYVSMWNFSASKVEYVPFHTLHGERLQAFIRGAVAIPLFSRGELIGGERYLDGAFVDNIPTHPMIDKDVDYVFCVYFDNKKYLFESRDFDKKVIKLFDFPNQKRLEMMRFDPKAFDEMEQYGYDYTRRLITMFFDGKEDADREEIYRAIWDYEETLETKYTARLTADIVLNNINVVTKHYAKRFSNRKKK